MKKFKNFVISFIILFISTHVYSFEDKKSELGFYFSTKVYEERHPVDNSFFMSQDGWMIGIDSNSESYEDLYTGFKTRLALGQVDYTSNGTGTITGVPDYQFETTGYLGLPSEGTNSRTTYFTGLGFRYLLNAMGHQATSTGHAGYDRESRYVYLPIGINFETGPWEFRGEYLHFLYGQQTSKLSQASPGLGDITNDQEEGSGIKLRAKYYTSTDSGYEFYTDYWDIADSKLDTTGNFMEPRNTTSELGIKYFFKF